jgi:hypothetical protein
MRTPLLLQANAIPAHFAQITHSDALLHPVLDLFRFLDWPLT